MPKTIYLGSSAHSGLDITWTKTTQRLSFSGWYDSFVGIEGESMTLREFFERMGITKQHCDKAWKERVE